MARLLAIQWDEREARVAVATARGGQAVVEQAFTVALRPGETAATAEEVGGKLGAALSARRIGRLDTLIAVGRPNIELRDLSLPPAPDAELPDLVRFQAMREFNDLGDDWPLDFMPIGGGPTEPRSVLAAAISPEIVEPLRATCQAAGLKPRRLALRACAAASLLRRMQPAATERVRLLVDVLYDEADLTVLSDDTVVFLRTTRLPGEGSPDQSKALLAELRRTMVAMQNRLGGQRVEAIYLCGDVSGQEAAAAQLSRELSVPAYVFDPFAGLQLGSELKGSLPAHPGRFAPLLGMLLDEAADVPPALDFFHPKQKPVEKGRRNKLVLGGAIAAVVAAVVLIGSWFELSRLDNRIAGLSTELTDLTTKSKAADQDVKVAGDIEKWAAGEIVWLDELRELAQKLPPSKDAMISRLHWQPRPKGAGGDLGLKFHVNGPAATQAVEHALRDSRHRVAVGGGNEDLTRKNYPWSFDAVINVEPIKPAGVPAPIQPPIPVQPAPILTESGR